MIEYTDKNINEWIRLGMRKAFGPMMDEIICDNKNIIVLTADVADSANISSFEKNYPNQFYNIGIAEQNMTGIASGLAKENNNVFITSFSPFVSMRNYEAVRTLVGYMHLNVKIVALASGMSLGVQGNTHYCFEDISLMKTIPGMTVLSPADVIEEAKCLEYLSTYIGPAYLRLSGIDGTPGVYKGDFNLDIEKPTKLREGEDIVILATGSIVSECVRAARAFKRDGLSCAVYDICCLKPLNKEIISEIIAGYPIIVTVEEHFVSGGLGTLISDISTSMDVPKKIVKIGIDDIFPLVGDYAYLLDANGLSAPHIRAKILENMCAD